MVRYLSLLFAAMLMISSVYAQTNTTNKEVKVISKYKSQLPEGEKINKAPYLVDTTRQKVNFSYMLNPHPVYSDIDLFNGDAPRIKGEPLQDINGGYLRLAGGNYSTWFGEFAYNNKRSRLWNWGVYFKHGRSNGKVDVGLGVEDKQETGFGNTDFNFYAKRFLDNAVASVSLSYDMDKLKYYGLDRHSLMKTGTNQEFKDFGIKFSFEGTSKSDIKYKARLSYNKFKDEFSKWDENLFVAGLNAESMLWGNILNVDIKAEHLAQSESYEYEEKIGIFNPKKIGFKDYSTLHLNPSYNIQFGRLILNLGLGIVQRIGFDSKLFIFPNSNLKFEISEDLAFYAYAKGNVHKNTLRNISKKNPFALLVATFYEEYSEQYYSYSRYVSRENAVEYTKYNVGGGLKGKIEGLLSYDLSTSYKYVRGFTIYNSQRMDFNYYKNTIYPAFDNYFMPRYNNGKILSMKAELSADINDNLAITSVFSYFNYSMDYDQEPLYEPKTKLNIRADYKFDSKLKIGAELEYTGERLTHREITPIPGSSSINVIYRGDIYESYTLVNLGAEYKFTDYVHAFAKVNNLFNTKYEIWKGYPNYRFNVLLGATFSF